MPTLSPFSGQGRAGRWLPLPGPGPLLSPCSHPGFTAKQGHPSPFFSTLLLWFWQIHLSSQLSKPFAKRAVRGLTRCVRVYAPHAHACCEDEGAGPWENGRPGRAQPWPLPAALPSAVAAIPLPVPDFLLLAFVLLCLPRAPNHSANSVCGERSPRVISG